MDVIFTTYPVHFGSPIRKESVQYSHKLINSETRNLGNSMNVRVIKSKLCLDVISTLFISFNTAIKMLNLFVAIASEGESQPTNK